MKERIVEKRSAKYRPRTRLTPDMILSCNNTEKTFTHLRAQQLQINNNKCERRDGLASSYNSIIHFIQYAFAER
jgi:hypothetical protein